MYYVTVGTSTSSNTCSCTSTATFGGNEVYYVGEFHDLTPPPRRRYQQPPPAYVLPCLPAQRAQLTPWKGRDYMLRRKV
jgi:hypothetical protein